MKAAGYDLGFSHNTGINHSWAIDPLNIRRFAADFAVNDDRFQTALAIPYMSM